MTKKERYTHVLDWFEKNVGQAVTELQYSNPYELLVAVILSAQCTDKRVNMTTPKLFEAFPSAHEMAMADPDDVFQYIRSISYPNNKAKNLVGMAKKLLADFGGEVPSDLASLLTIPGVGRKTANVMLVVAFDTPAMPVDTHVFRVSNRIGLTDNSKNPNETEQQLMKYIPKRLLPNAHHWLILHGRYVCTARKPKCNECGIWEWCKYYRKTILAATGRP